MAWCDTVKAASVSVSAFRFRELGLGGEGVSSSGGGVDGSGYVAGCLKTVQLRKGADESNPIAASTVENDIPAQVSLLSRGTGSKPPFARKNDRGAVAPKAGNTELGVSLNIQDITGSRGADFSRGPSFPSRQ